MTGKELFLPLLFDLFVVINFAENYRPREEDYIIYELFGGENIHVQRNEQRSS